MREVGDRLESNESPLEESLCHYLSPRPSTKQRQRQRFSRGRALTETEHGGVEFILPSHNKIYDTHSTTTLIFIYSQALDLSVITNYQLSQENTTLGRPRSNGDPDDILWDTSRPMIFCGIHLLKKKNLVSWVNLFGRTYVRDGTRTVVSEWFPSVHPRRLSVMNMINLSFTWFLMMWVFPRVCSGVSST
jgi:hypothetical protein